MRCWIENTSRVAALGAAVLFMVGLAGGGMDAQVLTPQSAQNVVPAYEGWLQNADGSYDLVFGYFNRNFDEEFDVPIGPDNHIEPGPADQGQPTHFYPRRSRFVFRIHVPQDFGKKEVVWTLTTRGRTEKTYGTLHPDYAMDDIVVMNNNGAGGSGGGGNNIEGNKPPTLTVLGEKARSVSVGESVLLSATSTDDGIPKKRSLNFRGRAANARAGNNNQSGPPSRAAAGASSEAQLAPRQIGSRCCPDSASGLRVSWFVYRGPARNVLFDPEQLEVWEDYRDGRYSPYSTGWEPEDPPADNVWKAYAKFTAPGTYVLRCLASDGGLFKTEDIVFNVK